MTAELAVGGWRSAGEVAGLLRYPDDDLRLRLQFAQDVLEGEALQSVVAFSEETARVSLDGMQELYTRTFDLNPVATLEIGWHLYGEQYERGRFLAELREQQDAVGVDATPELPDHLTAILTMIPRLDARLATPLVEERLLPALEKIARPLDEHGNPYRHLIAAARAVVGSSAAREAGTRAANVERSMVNVECPTESSRPASTFNIEHSTLNTGSLTPPLVTRESEGGKR